MPYSFLSFCDQMIANASEPMPFAVGSTTVSAAAVATAASIALPPLSRIASPACEACGAELATMPLRAYSG